MTAVIQRSILVIFILVAFVAAPAAAQTRVPDSNMGAVGLWAGVAIPSEDVLSKGWFVGVSGEWYATPRVSIRGQFGGAFLEVDGGGLDVSPMHFTGNVVYNWERGKWHPYVGGGIGWYRYRFGEGDNRPSDDKVGANLGGGIEYFFTRRDTLAGDITFHIVPGHDDIFGFEAKYWTLSGGYKRYF